MPQKFFAFLGSDDHYSADGDYEGGFLEDYCCEASDDYFVEWNDDDPLHGFAIFRSGERVECSNLVTVATAIIMQETLDVDTFSENGVETCQNCGGYWLRGDIPTRHSLNCRHTNGRPVGRVA